jgi:sulfur carrier protein ThiS adenylyltransferase
MMRIILNGHPADVDSPTAFALRDSISEDASVVLNGFGLAEDRPLIEGDSVVVCDRGSMPDEDSFSDMMCARNSSELHGALRSATVGIAGLGGLGSNIASMLVRAGIGHLVIADRDIVDVTNLNRQNYSISDLGLPKTEATERVLKDICPFVGIDAHFCILGPDNISDIFGGCDILCEALDDPCAKAMFVDAVLSRLPGTDLVVGSGMAGFGDANQIKTEKRFNNLYICGDGVSESCEGIGLMSPRVAICAGHMANAVIRRLAGLDV